MLTHHRLLPLLSILLLLVQQQTWLTSAAPTTATTAAPRTTTTVTTTKPVLLSASPADQKASSSEEDGSTADKASSVAAAPATTAGNGNVYGADNTATTDQAAGGKPKGYNQGYSYNTGIKPYRTGYTYFQPFGDAADQQNQQGGGGGAAAPNGAAAAPQTAPVKAAGGAPPPPPLPVELPNFFGLDPKTMGPMRVIPNQQVPVDENGIPNLDAIKIPEDNGQAGGGAKAAPAAAVAPVAPAIQQTAQNINPQDFNMGGDFNLNQILGGGGAQQPVQQPVQQQQFASNPANDNSMFDFAPPAAQNFDLPTNGGSNDGRDYNRLDNFAGNLNNFDTYLGDGSLPMIGAGNSGNNGGGGGGGLGDGFGFGGGNGGGNAGGNQAVPSEIANLNNAFGANTNQASNNDMINILNQLNGQPQQQQQQPNGNEMDFGNFGNAATNRNQFFPFF